MAAPTAELTKTGKKRLFIEEIRRNAHILDKDGDGELSLTEVTEMGKLIGLTVEEVEEFFKELDVDGDGGLNMKEIKRSSVGSFLFFNFILAPLCMFLVCIVLGWVLAILEGWEPLEGFYFVACSITGIGPFFELEEDEELTVMGEVAEIFISVLALVLSSAFIGISCLMSLASDIPEWMGIVNSPARGVGAMLIVLPLFIIAFCFILGSLFAALEEWTIREGFEYLIQMVCGISDPLTDKDPETDHAKITALAIAIAALGLTTVIVGLLGAMVACQDLVYFIEVKLAAVESSIGNCCCRAIGLRSGGSKSSNSNSSKTDKAALLAEREVKQAKEKSKAGNATTAGDVEMPSAVDTASGAKKSAAAKSSSSGNRSISASAMSSSSSTTTKAKGAEKGSSPTAATTAAAGKTKAASLSRGRQSKQEETKEEKKKTSSFSAKATATKAGDKTATTTTPPGKRPTANSSFSASPSKSSTGNKKGAKDTSGTVM